MINEVTITVQLVTGTTVQDSRQAEESCVAMLRKKLYDTQIASEYGDSASMGLFAMKILKVESEKI